MKWQPFTYQGQEYDLSHVHPFDWEYTAPATDKRPERTYKLMVQFSMGVFAQTDKSDYSSSPTSVSGAEVR